MGEQIKPDVPSLIKRITEIAALPISEKNKVQKFTREQLVELYVYLSELKSSHKDLLTKINEMSKGANSAE